MLVLQRLGHLAADDVAGQAFDHGGLAYAGLTDQDRVVLGPTGQHLHDALDLFVPTDHGIQLAFTGGLGEVATELVKHQGPSLLALLPPGADAGGGGFLALIARQQLNHLLTDTV